MSDILTASEVQPGAGGPVEAQLLVARRTPQQQAYFLLAAALALPAERDRQLLEIAQSSPYRAMLISSSVSYPLSRDT